MLIPFVCICVCMCACVRVCVEKVHPLLPVGEDYAQCHGKLGKILNEARIMHRLRVCLMFPLHIVTVDKHGFSYGREMQTYVRI